MTRGYIVQLQWGRGCYAAETRRRPEMLSVCRLSFNGAAAVTPRRRRTTIGPGQYKARFNGAAAVTPRRRWWNFDLADPPAIVLQWGRGCYAAETPESVAGSEEAGEASMGPRLLRRGDPPSGACALRISRGFNGAAAVTPRRQRVNPRMRQRLPGRFNGAAAVTPRRPRNAIAFRTISGCFNGAAAVTPRRPSCARDASTCRVVLQWGRGCYAAETMCNFEVQVADFAGASMGPRLLRRGDPEHMFRIG